MGTKKNMASIAKKSGDKSSKNKVPENKEIINDSFEVKAKKKIDDLLGSIQLTPQEKKEVETKISKEELGGIDWLSEQLDLLTQENKSLKDKLSKAGFDENKELIDVKNKIKIFYNEIQIYFNKWGNKVTLNKKEFNLKFLKLFPFLNE